VAAVAFPNPPGILFDASLIGCVGVARACYSMGLLKLPLNPVAVHEVHPRKRRKTSTVAREGNSGYFLGLAQLQYLCVSRAFAGMVLPPNQYIST